MSAYAIFIRDKTTDAEELSIYSKKAASARGDHPLKALVAYGQLETLEGPEAEGVVVLEFPSLEAAHAWYDSPEYQAAKEHRLKGSDYRVLLVQGV